MPVDEGVEESPVGVGMSKLRAELPEFSPAGCDEDNFEAVGDNSVGSVPYAMGVRGLE